MAAVYQVKAKTSHLRPHVVDESTFQSSFSQASGIMQSAPESMPDDFKANIAWANEVIKKMGGGKA